MRLSLKTMALTGLRLGKCLSPRQEHIDLKSSIIIVPPENTKGGIDRGSHLD